MLDFNFGADGSIKSAAEVELVKAYVLDSNRLLYILVDIGDRCLGPQYSNIGAYKRSAIVHRNLMSSF